MGFTNSMFDGIGLEWGLSAPSELLHRLRLTWDALNASWNDWVLGYGPDRQKSFMEALGMDDPSWRKMMLTLIGAVVALTLLISLMLMLRYRPPKRDRAAVLYRRFVRRTGVRPIVGETPDAFARRAIVTSPIEDSKIQSIIETYLDARYGSEDPAALRRLEREVAAIAPAAARFRRARRSAASPRQ